VIEPTDEMIYAFAGEPEITATDAHAIRVGLAAVLAIVERDQPFAKAGPDEEPCGKAHSDGRRTCQRRARHDVCVSWASGNGADAWVVDYDDLVAQITKLEGAFEVASSSRETWKRRALDAGWKPGHETPATRMGD
jgi:hypothetical protein